MKLLSDKWFSKYEHLVKRTFSKGKTPTSINGKVMEKYLNVQGQKDKVLWMAYEWENGIIVEQNHGEGLDTMPRDVDFSFTIDMTLPKKLLTGKIRKKDIMSSGLVDYNVNFIKFMPIERPFIYMQILKIIAKIQIPIIHTFLLASFNRTIKSVRKDILERGMELK